MYFSCEREINHTAVVKIKFTVLSPPDFSSVCWPQHTWMWHSILALGSCFLFFIILHHLDSLPELIYIWIQADSSCLTHRFWYVIYMSPYQLFFFIILHHHDSLPDLANIIFMNSSRPRLNDPPTWNVTYLFITSISRYTQASYALSIRDPVSNLLRVAMDPWINTHKISMIRNHYRTLAPSRWRWSSTP